MQKFSCKTEVVFDEPTGDRDQSDIDAEAAFSRAVNVFNNVDLDFIGLGSDPHDCAQRFRSRLMAVKPGEDAYDWASATAKRMDTEVSFAANIGIRILLNFRMKRFLDMHAFGFHACGL